MSNYYPFARIKSIHFDPDDSRFEFLYGNSSDPILEADQSTLVGYIHFNPLKDIEHRYVGLNQPEFGKRIIRLHTKTCISYCIVNRLKLSS